MNIAIDGDQMAMELDVPGFATERIDVVNISVTGAWRTGWFETERIVREGASRGLTIVVPAGNEGPYAYLGDPITRAGTAVSVVVMISPSRGFKSVMQSSMSQTLQP